MEVLYWTQLFSLGFVGGFFSNRVQSVKGNVSGANMFL